MHLAKFEIKNFKGIEQASFDWDDFVALTGENNCGKSSVLQALRCLLSGAQIKDARLFRNHVLDRENAIELTGHFKDLTQTERESPAVRGRMHGDQWIIKKTFWADADAEGSKDWKELYCSFSSEEVFSNWPNPDSSWAAFPQDYQPLLDQMAGRGNRPNQQSREQLKTLVRQQCPDLVTQAAPAWIENPGGGGNWKSNANSILPQLIFVEAVQDATEASVSKEASAYGRIVSLIVEKQMMQKPEVVALKQSIERVLGLFRPDPANPAAQAEEIRELERRINTRLNDVVGGVVSIETIAPDIRPVLLPSTELMLQHQPGAIKTRVEHQGHGLQRTLIMALLQILVEMQAAPVAAGAGAVEPIRAAILAVEEPELYMHPQMERKMRDALYKLAAQRGIQVICTTHSPVFLDMGLKHKSIVRVIKGGDQKVTFRQVTSDLFNGPSADEQRKRLRLISSFHPTVNEVFFATRVALLEEESAAAAFQRMAELTDLFIRHPHIRRDITIVDARGKGNLPLLQEVLNHFGIPYVVIYDEDQGNQNAPALNARIDALVGNAPAGTVCHKISPTDLEALLGYAAGKDKVHRALERVEELQAAGTLPQAAIEAMNWMYFGQGAEPA